VHFVTGLAGFRYTYKQALLSLVDPMPSSEDEASISYLLSELLETAECPTRFEKNLEPLSLHQVHNLMKYMAQGTPGMEDFDEVPFEDIVNGPPSKPTGPNASQALLGDYEVGKEAYEATRANVLAILSELAATCNTVISENIKAIRKGPSENKSLKQQQSFLFTKLFSLVGAQQRRLLLAKMFVHLGLDDQISRRKRYVDTPPTPLKKADYPAWAEVLKKVNTQPDVFPAVQQLQTLLAYWANKLAGSKHMPFNAMFLPLKHPKSYLNNPEATPATLEEGSDPTVAVTAGFHKFPADIQTLVQTCKQAAAGQVNAKL
jgi:hypothetical protein